MVSQGKLVCLAAVAAIVLLGYLAMGVKAESSQPCKYLKLKTGDATVKGCQDCCASAGLDMAVSNDACRCKSRRQAERCPCQTVHGACKCGGSHGVHEHDHEHDHDHDHGHDCPCKQGKMADSECPCKKASTVKCEDCKRKGCHCDGRK